MALEDHEQTRRHFDIVAEGLRSEIQQVAEGVATNSETLERFRAETARDFAAVRTEMADGLVAARGDFKAFRTETAHSFADVDRRLNAVESR